MLENWSLAGLESAREKLLDRPAEGSSAEYDTPPVALEKVAAVYPESAQERGLEGQVSVLVTIDEQGKVIAARIDKSRVESELEEAALAAARKWTFTPATRYGQPVRSTMSLPFRFSRAKN